MKLLLSRLYNDNIDWLRDEKIFSWEQWVQKDPNQVNDMAVNDREIYDEYLRFLPENVSFRDVLSSFLSHRLLEIPAEKVGRIPIEPTGPQSSRWKSSLLVPDQSPLDIYRRAQQRLSPSNQEEVLKARKDLCILYQSDPDLYDKLGISLSELKKNIRSISGLSVHAKKIQEFLNSGLPEEHQWTGIYNASLSGLEITPNDLEKFVKQIEVSEEGHAFYHSSIGNSFRKYIASSFLAINTHVDYSDISFFIGRVERRALGTYRAQHRSVIVSSLSSSTVAHEIGHVLDHKWGRQYLGEGVDFLTEKQPSVIPELHQKWTKKFREFVFDLVRVADQRDRYTLQPKEIFARFVAAFSAWVNKTARSINSFSMVDSGLFQDQFNESHYHTFVRLLQEKSYVDAKEPFSLV